MRRKMQPYILPGFDSWVIDDLPDVVVDKFEKNSVDIDSGRDYKRRYQAHPVERNTALNCRRPRVADGGLVGIGAIQQTSV